MEGDATFSPRGLTSGDFNPRPPWGGRRRGMSTALWCRYFNPRPPWGGRLCVQNKAVDKLRDISIHALRGEGDFQALVSQLPPRYFNPRPPWGGRQYDLLSSDLSMRFQSTPSVGRATSRCSPPPLLVWYFNPRPPWGGRRCRKHQLVLSRTISIHALRGEGDDSNRLSV